MPFSAVHLTWTHALMFILAGMSFSGVLFSCRKGCTDPRADNYNAKAKVDDGSCQFSAQLGFWMDSTTATLMQTNGVQEITIEVLQDGGSPLSGTIPIDQFARTSPPAGCQEPGVMAFPVQMRAPIQSFEYQVRDQTGVTWFNGFVDAEAGKCNLRQLKIF